MSLKNWVDFRISSKSVKFWQYENSCNWKETHRKILFGSISSRPIHFMKAGMLLHLLGSTDCVTTKKQHIETHLNQGVEFSYWQIWPILKKFSNLPNFSMTYNFFPCGILWIFNCHVLSYLYLKNKDKSIKIDKITQLLVMHLFCVTL